MAIVDRYSVSTRGIAIPDYAQPMPLGQGQTTPQSPVYTSTDVNELAVRLGSPNSFDRRGNVLFIDDFEGGINKWLSGGGLGGYINWAHGLARRGGFSCQLNVPNAAGGSSWMTRNPPYPTLTKFGMEVNINVPPGHAWQSFQIRQVIYSATEVYYFGIGYTGGEWQYIRPGPVFEEWVPLPFAVREWLLDTDTSFNSLKFVVDMNDTMQYVRMMINGSEYSLAGLEPYHRLAAWTPSWEIGIFLVDTVATWGFLDSVIITQNEPPNITM